LIYITTKLKVRSDGNLIEPFNDAAVREWRFKRDATGSTWRLNQRRRRLECGPTSSRLGCSGANSNKAGSSISSKSSS